MDILRKSPSIALMCLLAAVSVFWVGCDEDPSGSNLIRNDLDFSRGAGAFPAMGTEYAICCGPWEEGVNDTQALKIFFYGATYDVPSWKLFLAIDQVDVDGIYTFPGQGDYGPVKMFVSDGTTEYSSTTGESSGTIKVREMDCGATLRVMLEVDASIGSEFGQVPPVEISGTFEAVVYENPSQFGCGFNI